MAVIFEAQQSDYAFRVGTGAVDELLVVGFRGTEALSELFEFEIELACEDANIDIATIVGQPASLTIAGESGERRIHGICKQFWQGGEGVRFTSYFATIVPSVWLLTQNQRSRIFQNKSTRDIIAEVLKLNGVAADQ